MMEWAWAFPVTALIVSLTGLAITIYGLRSKANTDYVRVLEARVDHAEKTLERCEERSAKLEDRCAALKDENYDLLRRLQHVENVTGARTGS